MAHSHPGEGNHIMGNTSSKEHPSKRARSVIGGRASRAEVYGLFIAAVVLIGGGVTGAIAYTQGDLAVPAVSTSDSATPSPTDTVEAHDENGVAESSTQTDSNATVTPGLQVAIETCPYTPAELAYYDSIRTTKQQAVDYAQAEVNGTHAAIASNTAHLEELLAAPYRPIEVFQRHPDGTPAAWRVDSNDEIAFERQRIIDNQSELVRAEEALRQAIAARDLIPGC